MRVNYKYLYIFIVLFLIEVYIGAFIHDNIIRPFIGDVLVVCLIYFLLECLPIRFHQYMFSYLLA
ncbi:putative membrane protein YfcA [Clostridium beijerinckii]|nr:putative membrane protein YfcA [Clostridium beijerinckii]